MLERDKMERGVIMLGVGERFNWRKMFRNRTRKDYLCYAVFFVFFVVFAYSFVHYISYEDELEKYDNEFKEYRVVVKGDVVDGSVDLIYVPEGRVVASWSGLKLDSVGKVKYDVYFVKKYDEYFEKKTVYYRERYDRFLWLLNERNIYFTKEWDYFMLCLVSSLLMLFVCVFIIYFVDDRVGV